jgi:glycosyltransferase involved in cell wall biosynthesis
MMARILCFSKGGRQERLSLVHAGKAPRDFFYGTDRLIEQGYDVESLSSNIVYRPGIFNRLIHFKEQILSRLTKLGIRSGVIKHFSYQFSNANIAVSFTDGFSITLGHYFRDTSRIQSPYLIGCFHGLCDLEMKAPKALRPLVTKIIERSIRRLDHIAFFGPADRAYALERFTIDSERTSIIRFGVDTEFWRPSNSPPSDYIFSIGQDTNRDFMTLVNACVDVDIRIHTALPIVIPASRKNVTVVRGSYQWSSLTDVQLRELYQASMAIVVPLKDVYQPTGYSVTLQAMACGKPVILSRIKGLWAPDLLIDGENCLLVTPGDSYELANVIKRVSKDSALRKRLGTAARETILTHFSLELAAESAEKLIQIGLAAQSRGCFNER